MQSVLIDTDIAIDFLRGDEKAKDFILPLWEVQRIFLSMLSIYELYAGVKKQEKEVTEHFIQACRIETLTVEITQCAGEYYQRYREKGIILTSVDCLIWATAKIKKHKIATRNIRHYPDKSVLLSY